MKIKFLIPNYTTLNEQKKFSLKVEQVLQKLSQMTGIVDFAGSSVYDYIEVVCGSNMLKIAALMIFNTEYPPAVEKLKDIKIHLSF